MPPQQTNLIRDRAGCRSTRPRPLHRIGERGHGRHFGSGAPQCVHCSADDALSEKDAAGLAAASTRSVPGLLKRYWRAFQKRRQRQSLRASLYYLSDRELMDIGVTRGEIDYIARHRAIDTLRG